MKSYFLKSIKIWILLCAELASLWYIKNSVEIEIDSIKSFTTYIQNNGGLQFFLASHIRHTGFNIFFAYIISSLVLVASEINKLKFREQLIQTKLYSSQILFNIIIFFTLIVLTKTKQTPEFILENPHSFSAIIYTLSPIFWCLYFFSACNLFLSNNLYISLVKKRRVLAIISIAIAIGLKSDFLLLDLEIFWSKILLNPTMELASLLARAIGLSIESFPNSGNGSPIFGTSRFHVEISEACSGYEGLTISTILLAAYCLMERYSLELKKSLWIIPLAGFGMFTLNSLRIAILIAIGDQYSPDLAMNGFHSVAGWFNLLIVLSLSLLILNNSFFFKKANIKEAIANDKTPLLYPLMSIIFISLIIKIFTPNFNWLYPIPILVATVVIIYLRKYLIRIIQPPSWISVVTGIFAFLLWVIIIPVNMEDSNNFYSNISSVSFFIAFIWIIFRVIGAAIIIPISEELVFRGFIQSELTKIIDNSILKKISTPLSLIITSILFGILHSEIIAGISAGMLFGISYLYRRKIIDAIVSHSTANLLLSLFVIYTGQWSYW